MNKPQPPRNPPPRPASPVRTQPPRQAAARPAAPATPRRANPARAYTPMSHHRNSGALWLAVLFSLVAHAGVAWAVLHKPIGRINPELLRDADRAFRVTRAPEDLILDDGTDAADGSAQSAGADTARLAKLSALLLDSGAAPALDVPETDNPLLDVPVEQRPAGSAINTEPTSRDIEDDVLAHLRMGPAVDLPFVASKVGVDTGDRAGGDGGDGDSGGDKSHLAGGAGSRPIKPFEGGRTEARQMLDSAGIVAPIDINPPALESPTFDAGAARRADASPVIAAAPIDSAMIDFADLALEPTKQLNLPEHLDNDFEYAVTTYRPPPQKTGFLGLGGEEQDAYTYFRVDIRARRSLTKLPAMPKDVVFLIDTSGSVSQQWVNNAAFGVRDALGFLNEGDRFNIVFFKDSPAFFSNEGIQPANEQTIAAAQKFLFDAKSSGFTDVNRALSRLLVRDQAVQRVYHLVFISDGVPTRGVMNTREVINLITRDNDLQAGIYCVGIGGQQNRELLNFLAYRNKGFSVYADQPQQAATAVRDLMSRLRYPIIKQVRLNLAGLDLEEVFPHNIPNVHHGETFSIFGRYTQPTRFTARLTGANADKPVDFTFTRDLAAAPRGQETLPQEWAFWKLHHLYSELIRRGETPQIKAAMEEIRKKYGLKTLY